MVYLDNAATTFPKPRQVIYNTNEAVQVYGGNPGRGGHAYALRISEKIYNARCAVAQMFNAEPENVVFTANCTQSLNTAIKGLAKDGDHVIISCLEHNSVIRPVHKLYLDGKVTYSIAEYDSKDEKIVENFEKLITSKTKLIVCTHASNVSGVVMPIQKIGKLCEQRGITFIVDAAQTAGVLPIDMKQCNITALCMPGHKGLYATTGSGVVVFKEGCLPASIIEGGTGSASFDLEQPEYLPDKLESGTANTVGIMSLLGGIDFINKKGMTKIYEHEMKLCEYVYNNLKYCDNIILYAKNMTPYKQAPIVSFNVKGVDSNTTVEWLNNNGFALRGGLHCSPLAHNFYKTSEIGMVRFSPSIHTTFQNVDSFVKIVLKFAKNCS